MMVVVVAMGMVVLVIAMRRAVSMAMAVAVPMPVPVCVPMVENQEADKIHAQAEYTDGQQLPKPLHFGAIDEPLDGLGDNFDADKPVGRGEKKRRLIFQKNRWSQQGRVFFFFGNK